MHKGFIIEIIFILFVLIIIALVVYQVSKNKLQIKSSGVKKSEIIDGYMEKLESLDSKEEKLNYLKIINQELAMNIFFDQDEIRELMQKFAKEITK